MSNVALWWSEKKLFFVMVGALIGWALVVFYAINRMAAEPEVGVESPNIAAAIVVFGYLAVGILLGTYIWSKKLDGQSALYLLVIVYIIWHAAAFAILWHFANGTTAAMALMMSFIDIPVGTSIGYEMWRKRYLPLF